ncbi:hypothetical protein Aksp02_00001 [Akkermansia sp. NBRC 115031]
MLNTKGCGISHSQIVLGFGMALFRRFVKPAGGLLVVFFCSCTEGITSAQLKLGFHVTLFSLLL